LLFWISCGKIVASKGYQKKGDGVSEPEEPVDAELVEPAPIESATTEIIRRERRSEVLKPLDPDTLLESFAAYQKLLQRLLVPEDWQGAPNRPGSFVKKRGWRKIATAFDLDVLMIRSEVERDADGTPIRAEVWARAIAPSGRSMDGDGYCSADEPRFQKASGRQKLENDLRATATTRAMNRAISGLIGMGDVSAEEMDVSSGLAAPVENKAPFGPAATGNTVSRTINAMTYLLEDDKDASTRVFAKLIERVARDGKTGDYLPLIACRAIGLIATELKQKREPHLIEHHPVENATEGFGVCACGFRCAPDELQAHIDSMKADEPENLPPVDGAPQ
jgi:hypothetical protein